MNDDHKDIINKITYSADEIDRLMKINMRLIAKFKPQPKILSRCLTPSTQNSKKKRR